jgi:predicted patatin/cPLA2 family phospholipase
VTRRSLLLAGGGLKVAFQAGVLQVWLSEAGLTFDHYDACSGGAFNLALLCDGRTGIEIADLWREMRPLDGVSFSPRGFLHGRSIVTMDGYREKVFHDWGLDWDRIRASTLDATFTVHNRTHGRRETFAPSEMDPDRLVATLSQALWFPPVEIEGQLYTDAVFDTDANVDVAIDEHDADEVWVIWTVSRRGEWMPGAFAQFFHALEVSANGTLASDLDRIRWNNGRDDHPRYGKHVEARVLRAEVGMHYLALLNGDRLHRAVEQGVRAARAWCDDHGIPYTPIDRTGFYDSEVTLFFTDRLHGRLRGRPAEADLRLVVPDSGEFVNGGRQRVQVTGSITSAVLDGKATIERGYADILLDVREAVVRVDENGVLEVDDGVDPTRKRMTYVLHLRTPHTGRAVTFVGVKSVTSTTMRGAARDAMTMSCRVLEGHVGPDDEAVELATGLLWMGFRDVASQLVGARASGPSLKAEAAGLARYGALFAGSLWDVCARKVLTYAPF